MKTRQIIYAALAITALASCTSNDYVGDQTPQGSIGTNGAISFKSETPTITRSTSADVDKLNSNFVVFGYKTVSETPQTVFDNYQVNYVDNTANTTESNSVGWEYVGYTSKATTPITQSIKYWDFNASAYDFFAYSLGEGTGGVSPTYATASVMSNSTYTLTGNQAQLGACYISKKKHISSPWSTPVNAVSLEFMNFLSKIQLKFYETIPGYSVKDVKFYIASDTKSDGTATGDGLAPAIYTASTLPTAGTYTITFDGSNNPVVNLTSTTSTATSVSFPAAVTDPSTSWLSDYAARDYKEAEATVYLGRSANAATASKQISVIPNSTGATLTLKMDYTLVSRDGTGETIQVTGATATVPAPYTAWKPNHAYTYIFKISDNTNGQTGTITGLYPITLDAVVTDTQDGSQETITTVNNPSITTYAKASAVTTDNEYKTNANIYVVVGNGTTLTVDNAKLYKVTNDTGEGTVQEITEASVANALANGAATDTNSDSTNDTWTVTGAGMKSLIVTTIGVPTLTAITSIPAADSPTGADITINGAKFTPTAAGTYVFEYTDGSANKHYKVIKVVAAS